MDAQSDPPSSAGPGDGAWGGTTRTLPAQEPALLQRGDFSDTLAKTVVTSSKDAIGLLFRAAEQSDTDSRSEDDDDNNDDDSAGTFSARWDGVSETTSPLMYSGAQLPPQFSEESLALWKRHRFVVQGWFSAVEAISYLQL